MFVLRKYKLLCSSAKICRYNSTHSKFTSESKFVGYETSFSNEMCFINPSYYRKIPTYRVIDCDGRELNPGQEAKLNCELVTNIYKCMVLVNEIDKILYESQRQGRISFYMTNHGEEGTQVGSSAALQNDDLIYGQYRELGALLWRGFMPEQIMNQCYGNTEDWGKGKQMPVHYGSRIHHFVTISSPLTTQLPQAVGSAYAYKLAKNGRCVLVYFGEGAASEGDTHAAFNFAATLECPIIFFCRNNGFAISTPSSEQYKGDGIAGRAAGYGITALRVDGNDTLAVYNATQAARKYVMENNQPLILEAMTYRRGHHSTSDDSSAYRSIDEIKYWEQNDDPIRRIKRFMENRDWWNEEQENLYRSDLRKQLLKSFSNAEKHKRPEWQEMFNDVYCEMPDHLLDQLKYMEDHLAKYGEHYPLKNFKESE